MFTYYSARQTAAKELEEICRSWRILLRGADEKGEGSKRQQQSDAFAASVYLSIVVVVGVGVIRIS